MILLNHSCIDEMQALKEMMKTSTLGTSVTMPTSDPMPDGSLGKKIFTCLIIKPKMILVAIQNVCSLFSPSHCISVSLHPVPTGTCDAFVQADYLALTGGE